MLAEGAWDGRRVVPAGWIRTTLQPRQQTDWCAGYGYHWYLESVAGHRVVAGAGNGGQRLYVLPDLNLCVAVTAGNYDDPDQWRTPLTVLERVVLPVMA